MSSFFRPLFALGSVLALAGIVNAQPATRPILDDQAETAFSVMLEQLRIFRSQTTLQNYQFNAANGAHCFGFTIPNPYSGRPMHQSAAVMLDGRILRDWSECWPEMAPTSPPATVANTWPNKEAAIRQCSDPGHSFPPTPDFDSPEPSHAREDEPITSKVGQVGSMRWRVCRGTVVRGNYADPLSVVALFEVGGRSPVAVQTLDLAQVDGVEDIDGHVVVRARNTGNSPFPQDFTFYRSGGRWTAQPAGHLQNTVIDLIQAIGSAAPSVARQMIDVQNRTWGGGILLPGEGACCASGGLASGTLRWEAENLVPTRVIFSRIGRPALRYDYRNDRWSEVPLGDEWTLERHIAACWRGRSPLTYIPWLGLRATAAPDGRVTSLTLDADEQAPNRSPDTFVDHINAERAALLDFARSTVQRCPVPRDRVNWVNSRVHRVRFYGPWTQ